MLPSRILMEWMYCIQKRIKFSHLAIKELDNTFICSRYLDIVREKDEVFVLFGWRNRKLTIIIQVSTSFGTKINKKISLYWMDY